MTEEDRAKRKLDRCGNPEVLTGRNFGDESDDFERDTRSKRAKRTRARRTATMRATALAHSGLHHRQRGADRFQAEPDRSFFGGNPLGKSERMIRSRQRAHAAGSIQTIASSAKAQNRLVGAPHPAPIVPGRFGPT